MCGLRRLAFTAVLGDASTALRVTSEPVPAVVGMATNGSDGRVSGWPRPIDLQVVERVAAVGDQRGDGLARVERAAAAEADHRVARRLARRAPRPSRARSTVGSPATAKTASSGRPRARAPRAAARRAPGSGR